jgi:hypothetical protein
MVCCRARFAPNATAPDRGRRCPAGDLETVRRLVERDPSPVRAHYEYRTPLSFAVRESHVAVAEFLLA